MNMIMGTMMAAVSEGVALSEAAELPVDQVRSLVNAD